jgi:hypothetical protein
VGAGRGARPHALLADDRGVHGELLGDPERGVGQLQVEPDQRVATGAHPGPRPGPAGGTGAAAEERVHDVAEPAEATERAAAVGRGGVRVATEVDDAPLVRVGEHLVRPSDLLEPFLRGGIRVDVRMQLAGQPAVGPLDLLAGRVRRDTQYPVVVRCHESPSPCAP